MTIAFSASSFRRQRNSSRLANAIRHTTAFGQKGETHGHQRKFDASANHRCQKSYAGSESHLHPRVNPSDQEEDGSRKAEHGKNLVTIDPHDDAHAYSRAVDLIRVPACAHAPSATPPPSGKKEKHMGINGSLTQAQIAAARKAMRAPKVIYTPALIRQIKKRMAQGRPNTGRIS